MKLRRKQSTAKSTSATQTTLEPSETPPASVSAISRLTEATIVLALLTFAGYWFTFSFELGFFSYFDIPYYFVSVTPTLILSTSLLWVGLGAILSFVLLAIALMIILGPVGKDMDARHPKFTKIFGVSIIIACITIYIFALITDPKAREVWTVKTIATHR